jgi:hypothetical protein
MSFATLHRDATFRKAFAPKRDRRTTVTGPTRIIAAKPGRSASPSPRAEPRPAEPQTRALVAVEPPADSQVVNHESRRLSAAFVAHLIATAAHAPQTRELRRGTPRDASARYGAAAKINGGKPRYSRST